jgi:hypothetical protein
MHNRHLVIAAAIVAVLLLAFFLWPQTPGEITDPPPGDAGTPLAD